MKKIGKTKNKKKHWPYQCPVTGAIKNSLDLKRCEGTGYMQMQTHRKQFLMIGVERELIKCAGRHQKQHNKGVISIRSVFSLKFK